jgi:hypothetical protein
MFTEAAVVEVVWLIRVHDPLPEMLLGFRAVVPDATPLVWHKIYMVLAAGVQAAVAYAVVSEADDETPAVMVPTG